MGDSNNSMPIPVLDLSESEEVQLRVLREACSTTGFFYLTGHGVPRELIRRVFGGAAKFFQCAAERKDEFKAGPGEHPLGYQSAVLENIKLDPETQEHPDQREQLKFARRNYVRDYNAFIEGAGGLASASEREDDRRIVWLAKALTEEEEEWRSQVNSYFERVSSLGHGLLKLLAKSLGLEETHFSPFFKRPLELMNLNYYHAQKARLGCGSHTDYGMLTLLITDEVPGLQVCKDKSKPAPEREYVDVKAPPGHSHFVINVGDMLERWTCGEFVSNLHRVENVTGKERFSIAFFFEPDVDALISPIDRSSGSVPASDPLPPVVYGDWLKEKYNKTGEVI
ncbi:oxygenase [Chloropicon primus]|uniref:Oxygenase n=1 Tax=Chloropicon primus TaxID=1764295 RepID=A0A5B8MWE0_9CHLO|nr:oxygenase [Chloropicon primus]UPR03065.1 oxygenase [Chloropicon primus]|mmetsp:Transcript_14567/g.41577  ORF Transcript_14567/g.41577 Transcript_14567/m.41577 type:complete len:339 (-) Transcript_14567:1090-2106(-)|eukprot:QDZ23852.1 oxygenase [Chloropicon primus]